MGWPQWVVILLSGFILGAVANLTFFLMGGFFS